MAGNSVRAVRNALTGRVVIDARKPAESEPGGRREPLVVTTVVVFTTTVRETTTGWRTLRTVTQAA